jgi:hypothetical protein
MHSRHAIKPGMAAPATLKLAVRKKSPVYYLWSENNYVIMFIVIVVV